MDKPNYNPEIKKLRALIGEEFPGAFLAGGAVTSIFTNQSVNDLDLYFKSEDAFRTALRECYEEFGYWCVAVSPRAITFGRGHSHTVQLMYFKFFDSAEAIFDSFDFTCCMGALDTDSGLMSFNSRFAADVGKRELVFNHRTDFPLASGIRVRKYLERGFTINGSEWLNVLIACMFNKASGWAELEAQIGGHYGTAVKLAGRDREFTLNNVIEALKAEGTTDQMMLSGTEPKPEDPPATYDEAIKRIERMRSA